MNIQQTEDRPGRTLTLHLSGEFDLVTAPELARAIKGYDAGSFTDVRLDLSHVTFCDSTALSALIEAQRTVADAGGTCVVSEASRPIRRLLEVAGCDWLLSAPDDSAPAG